MNSQLRPTAAAILQLTRRMRVFPLLPVQRRPGLKAPGAYATQPLKHATTQMFKIKRLTGPTQLLTRQQDSRRSACLGQRAWQHGTRHEVLQIDGGELGRADNVDVKAETLPPRRRWRPARRRRSWPGTAVEIHFKGLFVGDALTSRGKDPVEAVMNGV
jgi:hypothetical protein